MFHQLNKLLPKKSIGYTALASVLPYVLTTVAYPIFTRLYTPNDLGQFAVFQSLILVIAAGASLKYELGIVITKSELAAKNLALISFYILLAICLVLPVPLYFLPSKIVSLDAPIFFVMAATLGLGTTHILERQFTRHKQFKQWAILRNSQIGIHIMLGILFAYLQINWGLIWGLSIGLSIAVGYFIIKNFRSLTRQATFYTWRIIKKFKIYPQQSFPGVMIGMLSLHSPILVTGYFFSGELVGFLAVAIKLIALPEILIQQIIGPVLFQKFTNLKQNHQNMRGLILSLLLALAILSFAFFFILTLAASPIFSLLFGNQWSGAGEFAAPLCLMYATSFIVTPFFIILTIFHKQLHTIYLAAFQLVITFGSIYYGYLIQDLLFGLWLMAIGNSFILCTQLVIVLVFVYRHDKGIRSHV